MKIRVTSCIDGKPPPSITLRPVCITRWRESASRTSMHTVTPRRLRHRPRQRRPALYHRRRPKRHASFTRTMDRCRTISWPTAPSSTRFGGRTDLECKKSTTADGLGITLRLSTPTLDHHTPTTALQKDTKLAAKDTMSCETMAGSQCAVPTYRPMPVKGGAREISAALHHRLQLHRRHLRRRSLRHRRRWHLIHLWLRGRLSRCASTNPMASAPAPGKAPSTSHGTSASSKRSWQG